MLGARREEQLEALAAELGGEERRSRCAATSPSGTQPRRWRGRRLDAFGRIDAVFANAGFGATRGFLEESPEHWRSMVLTNVLGVALTIRATLPTLLERGDGPLPDHQLGRRPARAAGLALLGDQVGGHRRWARRCARSSARCTRTTRSG